MHTYISNTVELLEICWSVTNKRIFKSVWINSRRCLAMRAQHMHYNVASCFAVAVCHVSEVPRFCRRCVFFQFNCLVSLCYWIIQACLAGSCLSQGWFMCSCPQTENCRTNGRGSHAEDRQALYMNGASSDLHTLREQGSHITLWCKVHYIRGSFHK